MDDASPAAPVPPARMPSLPVEATRPASADNPVVRSLALAYALHAAIHLSPCSQREVRDLGLLSAELVRELHALAARNA